MTNQQQEMIEYTTQEVIRYLVEEGLPLEDAFNKVYLSETFEKLNDIETGLYLEGSSYIFEMLKREENALK